MKPIRKMDRRAGATPYSIFMIAVTFLSLINLCFYIFARNDTVLYTISVIDIALSALFLIDFVRLFLKAPKKAYYFFKDFGWADLLSAVPLPLFNIFRLFRLARAYRALGRDGLKNILYEFRENPAAVALFALLFVILLLLEFGSIGILVIEQHAHGANILTAADALWWVMVTIATVGYGDLYPVTNEGRLFASFVMVIGVGLFGVVTGYLSRKFIVASREEKRAEAKAIEQRDAVINGLKTELREIRALLEKRS